MESTRQEPAKYRLADRFVVRRVGAKVFVLDTGGRMHTLDNATAVWVWDQLEAASAGALSVGALAASLATEFDVARAEAARDAEAFLEQLVTLGLVERIGAGAD